MTVKSQISISILLASLAAGCASKQEPIVFLSEAKIPPASTESAGHSQGLSKADEQKIDMVVFTHLLGQRLWEGGGYAAIFLQADNEVVTAMMQKFPNQNPPLKPADRLDVRTSKQPVDRDTGMPVMIFGVDVKDPAADGSVEAVGRWYAGGDEKGASIYIMKKSGEDWTISSVR